MSPLRPSDHRLRTADSEDRPGPLADALSTAARGFTSLTRTVAFWLGIVLPFLHVPLLLLLGFTDATTPALVSLWALNVVAVAVGSGHEPSTAGTATPAD
ncbi:MAG: hypothetical protein V5A28_15765 [Haloarculaceae archaeon]